MIRQKVSREYANAYETQINKLTIGVAMSIVFLVAMLILLFIAIAIGKPDGIIITSIAVLLAILMLVLVVRNQNKFIHDKKNLEITVFSGIITQKVPIANGFIYYFKATGSRQTEKITIVNLFGYDSWHLELKDFPLEVDIWRGLKTNKILRIEIKNSNKVLDIIGKK